MFFYSRLQANLRSYLALAALLSGGLTFVQLCQAQEQTADEGKHDWVASTMCALDNRAVDLEQLVSFSYTAADGNNPRHLDAIQALTDRPW